MLTLFSFDVKCRMAFIWLSHSPFSFEANFDLFLVKKTKARLYIVRYRQRGLSGNANYSYKVVGMGLFIGFLVN